MDPRIAEDVDHLDGDLVAALAFVLVGRADQFKIPVLAGPVADNRR